MAKREHLTSEDARAGATPGVMRYVLTISLVAIIVIFGIMLFLNR